MESVITSKNVFTDEKLQQAYAKVLTSRYVSDDLINWVIRRCQHYGKTLKA